jgi:hypothetical protein
MNEIIKNNDIKLALALAIILVQTPYIPPIHLSLTSRTSEIPNLCYLFIF